MNKNTCDFSGWATKNNIRCSDGRVILKDAFKDNDGCIVPLVWNHQHNESTNVLGHALLENREEGTYAYGWFNDTESGQNAKILVHHGDVQSLSIYANKLTQEPDGNVRHGTIREVSLVLAGANPGAKIMEVLAHSDIDSEAGFIVKTYEDIYIKHADDSEEDADEDKQEMKNEKTVREVLDTFNEEQKAAMMMIVAEAVEQSKKGTDNDESNEENDEGESEMKHNAFDKDDMNVTNQNVMKAVIADGKRYGSLKESFMAHAEEFISHDELEVAPGRGTTYGIRNVDYLYPDAQTIGNTPDFYKRDTDWVQKVMSGVHHTPFARLKSIYADITADEARAKGYITGHKKTEEVIVALRRVTGPTTVYKKQKMDRDDIVDITDFDVVAWLKGEMRIMLDEELARAILVGDGRLASSEDKINEQCIRPIWKDDPTYTILAEMKNKASYADETEMNKDIIRTAVKSRVHYKGSGNPTFFTTEDVLTDLLLLEDGIGHRLYDSEEKLATAMRVSSIVTAPVMERLTRAASDTVTNHLIGLIVNLKDYNVGADKGGAVEMFDDFDIDYNQQKYLIETRCSGALVKPKSAIAIELPVTNG